MTKRKTTAAELAKTSELAGKPSAELPVGYANLLVDPTNCCVCFTRSCKI